MIAAWAKEVRLIVTRGTCGKGTTEDPMRTVYQLFTHEGRLVAAFDPFADPEGRATAEMQGLMNDV